MSKDHQKQEKLIKRAEALKANLARRKDQTRAKHIPESNKPVDEAW
jgi:AmiR/NasT family two-component response regulator